MPIADKLQLTLDTKNAIKQALITKGATPTDVFSTYPNIIESLSTQGIATPQIIAPMNGAVQVSQQPIITATLYFSADPDDMHAASTWEFASDSGFTTILHTSGRDTVNLESYDLSAAGYIFPQDAQVYCRVTYESQSGVEQTSPVIGFGVGIFAGALADGDIVIGQHEGYWLLAVTADKRVLREWGSSGEDTSLPNNPVPDPNTGTYNTDTLIARGTGKHPAAEYCRSLGADYFLLNREQLDFLYQNKAAIDAADPTIDGSSTQPTFANIGNETARDGSNTRATDYVWSSTESSSDSARFQRLSDGYQTNGFKNVETWVVPVRRISV